MERETDRFGSSGEEWFEPAFLDRLRALFLRLRKRRRHRWSAKNLRHMPAAAHNREFRDYRSYSVNDDFRSVDWRVYARLGRLFVRLFEELQDYQVHLLIDTSSSMDRPDGRKRRDVLRLAVALGYLGLIGHHRVSLHTMRDRVVPVMPAVKGQGSIHRLIDVLHKVEFGGSTNLRACFEGFRPVRHHYAVTFVLSDLLGHEVEITEQALRRVGSWPGETHVVQILDRQERAPDGDGEVHLTDGETGEERRMWLIRSDLQRYQELFEGFLGTVERACASRQVDYLLWMTDRDFEESFTDLMDRGSVLGGRV